MGLASRCRSARDAGRARGVRWIRRIHDFHLLVGTSTTTAGSAFLGTAHLSARRTDRFPTIAPRGRRTSRKPGSASLSPPHPRRVPRETTRPGPVHPPPPTSSPSRARRPSSRAPHRSCHAPVRALTPGPRHGDDTASPSSPPVSPTIAGHPPPAMRIDRGGGAAAGAAHLCHERRPVPGHRPHSIPAPRRDRHVPTHAVFPLDAMTAPQVR